jgi:hypothetical protein
MSSGALAALSGMHTTQHTHTHTHTHTVRILAKCIVPLLYCVRLVPNAVIDIEIYKYMRLRGTVNVVELHSKLP